MAKRRGKGEGSITQRADGRWMGRVDLGRPLTDLRVSVPGEVVPAAEFYDYEDKYLDGRAELVIPADLPDDVTGRFQALALEAFRALRAEGMARVDFLYEEGGRGPLLNEINTIPGFTPISMYPKLWEASGLAYDQLIDELVRLAIERHERRTKTSTSNCVDKLASFHLPVVAILPEPPGMGAAGG